MSKPIRISSNDQVNFGVVAYLYEKASTANTSDLLVGTWQLNTPSDVVDLQVTPTRYVVIRDCDDDAAKTIDNW